MDIKEKAEKIKQALVEIFNLKEKEVIHAGNIEGIDMSGKEVKDMISEQPGAPFVTETVENNVTETTPESTPTEEESLESLVAKFEGYVEEIKGYATRIEDAATRIDQAEKRLRESSFSKLANLQVSVEMLIDEAKTTTEKADVLVETAEKLSEEKPKFGEGLT